MSFFLNSGNRNGAFGTLRQELDSLIRAFYLLLQDHSERDRLCALTLSGERWRVAGQRRAITDREMVDRFSRLQGWARYAYRFGSAFIHLSNLHSADDVAIGDDLSFEERSAIIEYIQQYHSVDISPEIRLEELFPVAGNIFEKIKSNLEYYLRDIENGETSPVL